MPARRAVRAIQSVRPCSRNPSPLPPPSSGPLARRILELQGETIVRRYPSMRVASLRLSWSLPSRQDAMRDDPQARMTDLWGYVQEDSGAEAFLLALTVEDVPHGILSAYRHSLGGRPGTGGFDGDRHPTV